MNHLKSFNENMKMFDDTFNTSVMRDLKRQGGMAITEYTINIKKPYQIKSEDGTFMSKIKLLLMENGIEYSFSEKDID